MSPTHRQAKRWLKILCIGLKKILMTFLVSMIVKNQFYKNGMFLSFFVNEIRMMHSYLHKIANLQFCTRIQNVITIHQRQISNYVSWWHQQWRLQTVNPSTIFTHLAIQYKLTLAEVWLDFVKGYYFISRLALILDPNINDQSSISQFSRVTFLINPTRGSI